MLAVGRGGSAFWYWDVSLIHQLEIELEKCDGKFLHKKKVFSSCAVAVRMAPVVTIVAECIYIYTMLEYNIQVITIEMTRRKP